MKFLSTLSKSIHKSIHPMYVLNSLKLKILLHILPIRNWTRSRGWRYTPRITTRALWKLISHIFGFYPVDWWDLFEFRDFSIVRDRSYVTKARASTGDKIRAITFRILPLRCCNEPLIFLLPCYMVYLLRTYLFMPRMRSLQRIKIILCQRCRCTFKQ